MPHPCGRSPYRFGNLLDNDDKNPMHKAVDMDDEPSIECSPGDDSGEVEKELTAAMTKQIQKQRKMAEAKLKVEEDKYKEELRKTVNRYKEEVEEIQAKADAALKALDAVQVEQESKTQHALKHAHQTFLKSIEPRLEKQAGNIRIIRANEEAIVQKCIDACREIKTTTKVEIDESFAKHKADLRAVQAEHSLSGDIVGMLANLSKADGVTGSA
eukprot:CAMPEP_0185186510 /NCGR_PEP_ID=MMETSP1140-20130426/4103_1 /TAXON_ID=298111 /ORGANISM="Pavlova sp., Strain CCMP459" /LENGTH=213 /DNA_ID=CAMNT_0027752813 /DNA_START=33 /DNA_END=674 /DNA_ORIENTATION=-